MIRRAPRSVPTDRAGRPVAAARPVAAGRLARGSGRPARGSGRLARRLGSLAGAALVALSFPVASSPFAPAALAQDRMDVAIAYLERVRERPPTLSNLDPVPADEGLAGARLAVEDNATTGRFLGQDYRLIERVVEADGDWTAAAREVLAGTPLVVVNAPADDLLVLADLAEAKGAVLLNAGAPDDALRGEGCRANVLHALPSRAMLADALAQFAGSKRWGDWALIVGPREGDGALAAALERSAAKFGLRLRDRLDWTFDADLRRSASAEVPLFTQDLRDHDVLVVADEANDFARYVLYNTWLPRPVAGSDGLVPAAWHAAVEQHGAAQLQSRFEALAGRDMRAVDYAAWVAARALGEAVTRTGSADPATLRDYMLGEAFELGGFKGRPLSFRPWNGQLRQPIPLAHEGAVVALAPLEGFLHPVNEMDTLGLDAPEAGCAAFQ